MRPFTRPGVRSARSSQRRTLLIGAVVAFLLAATAAPAAALGPRSSAFAAAATPVTRLPASTGRSASGGKIDLQSLLASASRSKTPDFAPVQKAVPAAGLAIQIDVEAKAGSIDGDVIDHC